MGRSSSTLGSDEKWDQTFWSENLMARVLLEDLAHMEDIIKTDINRNKMGGCDLY
jgi:hypothetical protein